MKQKIVVKVQMWCQDCRTKAFKIAASLEGVDEVRLEGKEKEEVVLTGEGMDPICLVKSLRKKVGHSDILSISEVKPASKKQ
ncbi:disease resistance protein Pik-1-like [Macadamia integrifolia]|uniref:disease resistance protein Pik-1-like n=1 Tax=Macadamia integrifolia TaxID=60698 RepID=UPI001C4FDD4A|nr:disease resistance protein Pik-1-like [Macadamia integrifolia]